MLELVINGESIRLPETVTTVTELLAHFGLDQKIVVVEINQKILEKSTHPDTPIRTGDRIEMVHFVGGG